MRDDAPRLKQHGTDLAVVGSGTAAQAADLAVELALEFPVYTDPDRQAFAALGARRSLAGIFHPGTFRSTLRAWRRGFRQRGVQGDAIQLGGVVAIRPGDEVAYLHLSGHAGDHPSVDAVLAAL